MSLKKKISALILTATVGVSGLIGYNAMNPSKPKTPLSLYAFLHLRLAESIRLIPIILTSNPASSKIALEVFTFSYSAINCNLNSSLSPMFYNFSIYLEYQKKFIL